MLNSRDISLLRPDVAANCRIWLRRCEAEGLKVLITGTVRDEEYQLDCYNKGYSKAKVPSFHGIKAGLAFDFCKNVKGQEYSDTAFFHRAAGLAEEMGFEWGGRWKSFPDLPHLQWSDGGRYTGAMIRAGQYPPPMPLFEEEIEVTKEELKAMVEALVPAEVDRKLAERDAALAKAAQTVSPWAAEAWQRATEQGLFDGTRPGAPLTREQAAVVLERAETIKK